MSEILQRWLGLKLGIILDMDPHYFGANVSDGVLLARLLHCYDIINADQMRTIIASNNPASRYSNLKNLRIWLETIGVECDDNALREIAECKGSTAIRLFYQIFLCLENKDRLYFINQQRRREMNEGQNFRFEIEKQSESILNEPVIDLSYPLDFPLVAKRDMIEWKKEKMEAIKSNLKKSRERYDEYIKERPDERMEELFKASDRNESILCSLKDKERERIFSEITKFDRRFHNEDEEEVDISYSELLKLGEKVREYDYDDKCACLDVSEAKDYLKLLHKRARTDAASKSFKQQMQNLITKELWSNLIDSQEREFDHLISKKLLKQSQYEKQMTTKLYQIRHEKKVMAENRALVEKIILEKREEEFGNALNRAKDEIEAECQANDFEASRNLELHQRLYREKLQKRHEKHYDICHDIMDSFVDLSMNVVEFKAENENKDCIPRKIWNEWRELFFKFQPIFDAMDDIENIVDDDYEKEIEEIILLEFGRQEVLNEHDMDEYFRLLGPWLLVELCPELQPFLDESMIVLGYVVHRLLDLKYPLPPPPSAADLPAMTATAIVNGVNDQRALAVLKDLLAERSILIVFLEDAINYCLEMFKEEMSVVVDIDLNLCRKTKVTIKELKESKGHKKDKKEKKQKKEKKAKKEKKEGKKGKKGKGKDKKEPPVETVPAIVYEEKETQTPRRIPDDDPLLTLKASLGRQAFEVLCLGEQIPDILLVPMLVEYLKSLQNLRGWVILNYPMSYEQASLLEEALTGLKLPSIEPVEQDLVEVIEEIDVRTMEDEEDPKEEVIPLEELRASKLVPNPIPPREVEAFKTYFTAYINAKKADTPVGEYPDLEVIDENISPLERVYTDQGMNYMFYYQTFDFPTVKHLARLIIGDMSVPRTKSQELFGEDSDELAKLFVTVNTAGKAGGKKDKAPKKALPKKGKGAQSKKKVKEIKAEEEITVEEPIPEVVEEPPAEETSEKGKGKKGKGSKGGKGEKGGKGGKGGKGDKGEKGEKKRKGSEKGKSSGGSDTDEKKGKGKGKKDKKEKKTKGKAVAEVPGPKPGEPGYVFVNLRQPEIVYLALATLWENLEQVYLKDFGEVFFLKRINYRKIVPYLNYVSRGMHMFLCRPDNKQMHVSTFQISYNEIDEELRPDIEMKCELHCRVGELRTILWDVCDERKLEAEQERQQVIAEDWVAEHMCTLTNIFMEALQLEADRFIDTVQLLNDNYITMVGKLPAIGRLPKLGVERLLFSMPRRSLEAIEGVPVEAPPPPPEKKPAKGDGKKKEKGGSKKAESVATNVVQKKNSAELRARAAFYKETINKLLLDTESDREPVTPYHVYVQGEVTTLASQVDKTRDVQKALIVKERKEMEAKIAKKAKKDKLPGRKGKGSKDKGSKKDKSSKADKSSKGKSSKSKGSKKSKGSSVEVVDPYEEVIMAACKNMFEEWDIALASETQRTQFRLKLLQARAKADLSALLSACQDTFFTLHAEITSRYEREVDAVDQLCRVLGTGIEEESPIQHELVLEQDRFYIDYDVILYPNPPTPPPPPVEEVTSYGAFRVAQLEWFARKMLRTAPTSVVPERAFVYMLDDMVVCGSEEGDGRILPKIWDDVSISEIPTIVEQIFGVTEFVDWKDFVIYALNVGYPTVRDILELRNEFREVDPQAREVVNYENYQSIRLWFEEEFPCTAEEGLRLEMAKQFLFSLFQVGEDECNYTALLLYFCKDVQPVLGFAKALALSMGVRVVTTLEEYLVNQDDALSLYSITSSVQLAMAQAAADDILDEVLREVIERVAGITIQEVFSEETLINEVNPEDDEILAQMSNSSDCEFKVSPAPATSEEFLTMPGNVSCRSILTNQNAEPDTFCSGVKLPCTSYLSFGVVLNLLTICFPWHDKQQCLTSEAETLSGQLEAVYELLAPGQQTVLAHQLFEHPFLNGILNRVHKFQMCNIEEVISSVIQARRASEEDGSLIKGMRFR